jgi:hypothetical protein
MGAFFVPGLVVLSALVVFAGTAVADDGRNSQFVGGITGELGIGNADVGIENTDSDTNGDYVLDVLLFSSDEVSYLSVLIIHEFATITCFFVQDVPHTTYMAVSRGTGMCLATMSIVRLCSTAHYLYYLE